MFTDVPRDAGRALDLEWKRSPDDSGAADLVSGYVLLRAASLEGPWTVVDSVGPGVTKARDATVKRDASYYYLIAATGPGGRAPAGAAAGPAIARAAWYLTEWAALAALALAGMIAWAFFSRRRS